VDVPGLQDEGGASTLLLEALLGTETEPVNGRRTSSPPPLVSLTFPADDAVLAAALLNGAPELTSVDFNSELLNPDDLRAELSAATTARLRSVRVQRRCLNWAWQLSAAETMHLADRDAHIADLAAAAPRLEMEAPTPAAPAVACRAYPAVTELSVGSRDTAAAIYTGPCLAATFPNLRKLVLVHPYGDRLKDSWCGRLPLTLEEIDCALVPPAAVFGMLTDEHTRVRSVTCGGVRRRRPGGATAVSLPASVVASLEKLTVIGEWPGLSQLARRLPRLTDLDASGLTDVSWAVAADAPLLPLRRLRVGSLGEGVTLPRLVRQCRSLVSLRVDLGDLIGFDRIGVPPSQQADPGADAGALRGWVVQTPPGCKWPVQATRRAFL
jgi:hypothetical protein